MSQPALELDAVTIRLPVRGALAPIVEDVSLSVQPGEALGLVGESGSGKSMTLRAVARLLPARADVAGTVTLAGTDVLALGGAQLRRFRARHLGMIFQDPRAHLDPLQTIGRFMVEGSLASGRRPDAALRRRAVEMLDRVSITSPDLRMRQYPHELSGGMLQRVMIAGALLHEPDVLLADEPTTGLDVITQRDVVALMQELRRERGMAIVFVSHDLDLAGALCDRMAVMYAGNIQEVRPSALISRDPRHPYTAGLLRCKPELDRPVARLATVPGTPISAFEAGAGCVFASRCEFATDDCTADRPAPSPVDGGVVRCIRHRELQLGSLEEVDA